MLSDLLNFFEFLGLITITIILSILYFAWEGDVI